MIVANSLYSFSYWPLLAGGFVGLLFPTFDHLLHIFALFPQELTSQRVLNLVRYKQYKEAIFLIYDTSEERKNLMFHTTLFQIIFAILTFWVVSSSGSLFARGLVLSYFLSLTLFNLKKFVNKEIFFIDENNTRIYFALQVGLLFVFGLLI